MWLTGAPAQVPKMAHFGIGASTPMITNLPRTRMRLPLSSRRLPFHMKAGLALFGCLITTTIGSAYAADPDECPDSDGFKRLVALGSVYLGEIHGTEQAPRIVKCVIESSLVTAKKPIVVAIELPSIDTPDGKYHWAHFQDGKTSQSMWNLIAWLRARESEGALKIHYQSREAVRAMVESGQNASEKVVADEFRDIATSNVLIAYGGGFHSRRNLDPGVPGVTPAGVLLGDLVGHVLLAPNLGGEAWGCTSATGCGPMVLPPMSVIQGSQDSLVDGSKFGQDFLYLLGAVTVAKPHTP
jgi:hypothetical protein